MNKRSNPTDFLAVLIYEDGKNRYSEEPHKITAEHPEIAYQIALRRGAEERYGRRFIGLSHLEVATAEVSGLACTRGGDAAEHVCPKCELEVFNDARWSGIQCTDAQVAEALREPHFLVELEGLDDIPWNALTHAYGVATDVPIDLRRVGSSDGEVRENAVWQLGGSIYHQGTLYPATAPAIPFLIRLATDDRLPNRNEICGLLAAIAESCTFNLENIRKAWSWRKKSIGEKFAAPTEEMAEREIVAFTAAKLAMKANYGAFVSLSTDPNEDIAELGSKILKCLGDQAE